MVVRTLLDAFVCFNFLGQRTAFVCFLACNDDINYLSINPANYHQEDSVQIT